MSDSDWVMVPRQATREMFEAAAKVDNAAYASGSQHGADDESIYDAMVAAAPAPPPASATLVAELREHIAKAIVQADEQNGGAPWDYLMLMGKHVIEPIYDRADAVMDALTLHLAGPTLALCIAELKARQAGAETAP